MKFDKQDALEKILVSTGLVGIFLPVRLVFYTYVTQYWLGSIGMVSLIAGLVTYLAHKDKLGYFGRIYKKQIYRMAKGRIGKIALILSVTAMAFYGFSIYAFTVGTQYPVYDILMTFLEEKELTIPSGNTDSIRVMQEMTEDISISGTLEGMAILSQQDPEIFFKTITVLFAILDGWSGGWFQHFYIVFFVEEIEKMGIIIYFRYFYKRKPKTLKELGY